jgi:oligoendopeptidase F
MNDIALSSVPTWDLSDIFEGLNDPFIEETYKSIQGRIKTFENDYKKAFNDEDLDGSTLFQAICDYEVIEELFYKILSYSFLHFSVDSHNSDVLSFYQNAQERCNELSTRLIFLTLGINKLSDDTLNTLYENCSRLQAYKPWIDGHRLYKEYQLSEDLEKLLQEKATTSSQAWERLYEETLNTISIKEDAKTYTLADILNNLSSSDASVRKKAAHDLSQGLQEKMPILSLVTNTLAKDKAINDTWRKYPSPTTSRHLSNQVEEDVVEALASAVKNNYGSLSHRYYALKAKWMGVEKIQYWDRNAPLLKDELTYSWSEAQQIVFNAYYDFSPRLAQLVQTFFDNPWIDAKPRTGKESGAFSHPTFVHGHPYILMNYYGKRRDIMTLAHELGHGAHQILSNTQGQLLCDTPLTVAETASVFGEMLTFKALLKNTTDAVQRKALIASKVEDMLNTVVRQIAFYEFEKRVHLKRREGELSVDLLNTLWMETQKEALGESVELHESIKPYWAYISHFIRAPFYVYAYAFGDCLVNAIYGLYEKGHNDFEEKYLDLLKAGGSKRYDELLEPFGLNAKDPSFWKIGLDVIGDLIDELERF